MKDAAGAQKSCEALYDENFTVQHVTSTDVDPEAGCQQLNVFILHC